MKTTASLALLLTTLTLVAVAQDTPPPATTAAPSATPVVPAAEKPPATAQELINSTLPKYAPPPPVEAKPANAPNPDVLELPKMVVKQKPRPRLTPEIMTTRQGFGEGLAKKKFGEFDQVLNKFTLPLFGASMAERALEEHEREKKAQMASDVQQISKALEQVDPAEAKALREAAAKP